MNLTRVSEALTPVHTPLDSGVDSRMENTGVGEFHVELLREA
jgi:hypothetical protein